MGQRQRVTAGPKIIRVGSAFFYSATKSRPLGSIFPTELSLERPELGSIRRVTMAFSDLDGIPGQVADEL